jgi:phosphotransferase system HPr (HPr) family protein
LNEGPFRRPGQGPEAAGPSDGPPDGEAPDGPGPASAAPDASDGGRAFGSGNASGGAGCPGSPDGSDGPNGSGGPNGKARPFIKEQSLIRNRLGLHSRAAARLSQALEPFDCEIYLEKGEHRADAKNILDLISLCCPSNTRVTLVARGPEAGVAIEAAKEMIHNRFGEDE